MIFYLEILWASVKKFDIIERILHTVFYALLDRITACNNPNAHPIPVGGGNARKRRLPTVINTKKKKKQQKKNKTGRRKEQQEG